MSRSLIETFIPKKVKIIFDSKIRLADIGQKISDSSFLSVGQNANYTLMHIFMCIGKVAFSRRCGV
jgi:hypothetical protein